MTTLPKPKSHWQRGCDDGKAGRGPTRPHPAGFTPLPYGKRMANEGYMNGYRFGVTRRHQPTHDEGSLC